MEIQDRQVNDVTVLTLKGISHKLSTLTICQERVLERFG